MANSTVYDDVHVVVLSGDLDLYQAAQLRRTLNDARDKERVILDMSGVDSVSAAALTEFVRCYKYRVARQLQPARLAAASRCVRRVFEITGLGALWQFYESVEAATEVNRTALSE